MAAETPTRRAERLSRDWSHLIGGPVGMAECGCPNNALGQPPALHICRACGYESGQEVHTTCSGCARIKELTQPPSPFAFGVWPI